jgi:hypothetical protein
MLDAPDNGLKPSEPGWLGLEALDRGVDWKTIVALGAETVCVRVDVRSPAKKAGLRTGDYVIEINTATFEAFHAGGLQPGTRAVIKAWRDGQVIWGEATISLRPKPARKEKLSVVPCGADVARNDRLKWLTHVTGDPVLLVADKALAARLMVRYANRSGVSWPGIKRLAADLGVARRTIDYSIQRLHRAGYVDIKSGKKEGRSNEYTLTWPALSSANVHRLRP